MSILALLLGLFSASAGFGPRHVAGACGYRPDTGPIVTDKTAGFSIEFPVGCNKPVRKASKVPGYGGMLPLVAYTTRDGDYRIFSAGYVKYPVAAFNDPAMKTLFDAARDSALSSMHGLLDKDENITVAGKPGRRIYVSLNQQANHTCTRFEYFASKPYLIFTAMTSKYDSDMDTQGTNDYFSSITFAR